MPAFSGVDGRDIDREMMRQSRPITAIKPIETETVLVTDVEGRLNGERPSPDLRLAISVRLKLVRVANSR